MHRALYRKWRPADFDDVYGQEHITSILKYETEKVKFSHAYLFCGSRGTGKTSCAKILAKAVNCESPIGGNPCNKCAACLEISSGSATDVLEMDAASNNGVENIRDIRDEVVYTPSSLKYRVYIIDEVHMLSASAFNALLKTLEEPPAHVIFILATTELHKLPATIISRCKRFEFRRIGTDTIVERLKNISDSEGFSYEEDALRIIAKYSQGGMRDAVSLLELCAGNSGKITEQSVRDTAGIGGREKVAALAAAVAGADYPEIFAAVEEIVRSSVDISVFFNDLIAFYRDMLVIKTVRGGEKYLDLTDSETQTVSACSDMFTKESLIRHGKLLEEALAAFWRTPAVKRTTAEMTLIKMADTSLDISADALLERISQLEAQILSGEIRAPQKLVPAKKEKNPDTWTEKPTAVHEKNAEKTVSETDKPAAIRAWADIVENSGAFDIAEKSFLKMARAYFSEDGGAVIVFDSGFYTEMLQKVPNIFETLAKIIGASLKKNIPAEGVRFEVRAAETAVPDDLADFIQ